MNDELENDVYHIVEDVAFEELTVEKAVSQIMLQVAAHTDKAVKAAYKEGYAKGGVEEILRYEKARKSVIKELQEGKG